MKKVYQRAFVQTKTEPSHTKGWLFFLLLSFFMGILYGNLFGEAERAVNLLGQYSYQTVDNEALFFYCFRQRLFPVVCLYFLGSSFAGNLFLLGFFFYVGFTTGAFLSIQIIGFGIGGVLIGAGSLLPHYLIYLPAYWILFRFVSYARSGEYPCPRWKGILLYCLRFLVLAVLICAGVWLESFVNPSILQGILKWLG